MEKINVLMSAYNGEKYIKTQIDSVLNQIGVDVKLFIRDDGSSDDTLKIIRAMASGDERITCFAGDNIGVKFSFLKLLELADSDADYYAFCDQDDFWENRKLIEAINFIESKYDEDIPVLYYSHTTLVDENLKKLNIDNPYNLKEAFEFGEVMIKNCASGCTMVFNRKLKSVVNGGKKIELLDTPLHDHWLYMICLAVGGKVAFDNRSFILYRQHSSNVIGGERNFFTKMKDSPLFRKDNIRYKWALQLNNKYGMYIIGEEKRLLDEIVSYRDSFVKTIRLAFNSQIKPKSFLEKVVVFFTIIKRGY